MRVFRGPLSGRYFAALSRQVEDGSTWVVQGEKYDVTEDIEALFARRLLAESMETDDDAGRDRAGAE